MVGHNLWPYWANTLFVEQVSRAFFSNDTGILDDSVSYIQYNARPIFRTNYVFHRFFLIKSREETEENGVNQQSNSTAPQQR